jgi:hypothetical protein
LRTQYFEAVTSFDLPGSTSDVPIGLLEFEYFRRFQLDVQTAFYRRRSEDHRRDADRLLGIGAWAVALASISAGLAAVLSSLNPAWVTIAALGTIATAMASFASTKESVNQNRRNMELYGKTYAALTQLRGRLDALRSAAATGQRDVVKQFVAAVHEQLSTEHRQWLGEAEAIQPAIDKLDEELSKLRPKPKDSTQLP